MARSVRIGMVDTTFSRVNMGAIALDEIEKHYPNAHVIRRTVPGIKDLAVESQRLLTLEGCEIVLAMGMVGGAPVDEVCAHESGLGIQQAMLRTNKHIIEVFVYANERKSEAELLKLTEDRVRKHLHNAIWMVAEPQKLVERAGTGRRQGHSDEGPILGKKTRKK